MKICFVYNSVFRHGGVQRVIANVVNELSKHYEIDIICNEDFNIKNNFYNMDLKKVKVIRKNILEKQSIMTKIKNKMISMLSKLKNKSMYRIVANNYFSKKTKSKIIKFLNEKNYDIVIGCMMPFNLLLGAIKDSVSCKVIGWENNAFDSYFRVENQNKIIEEIYSLLLGNLDEVVVLTEGDKQKYKQKLNLDTKVISNPLGIYTKIKSNCQSKIILSVGRLEYEKGSDLLIDIFEKFSQRNSEWKLIIVGEGEYEKTIQKKIKEKNLQNKVTIEKFTNKIGDFFKNAGIYTSTSRYESFGLTLLEAMEYGLPVISFKTSGPFEITNKGQDGIIIENYNIDEYVKLLEILSNNLEIREYLSKKSINRAKRYDISNIIPKWHELIISQMKSVII